MSLGPVDSIDTADVRVSCVPILVIELDMVVRVFRRPVFCTVVVSGGRWTVGRRWAISGAGGRLLLDSPSRLVQVHPEWPSATA